MSMNDSQKPIMLYRVCMAFFLFLAVLFYWRCTKAKGSDFVSVPPQQCDVENTEFGNQQKVNVSGYDSNAMEPFITRDGLYLFFNSLNDGDNTSLYYATGASATSFTLADKITGVNGTPPHRDAVASMDDDGEYYFISTRAYPWSYKNVYTGIFSDGAVAAPSAVDGDFYIEKPGWIVMDAEVSPTGEDLYFVNAYFSGGSYPRTARIGVATRSERDNRFYKKADTEQIMARVNNDGCLNYAPCISADGKELFFTRFCYGSSMPSILVAKRTTAVGPFGAPRCIGVLKGLFVEAPSLSYDGKKLYYHRKEGEFFSIYVVSRP